MWSAPPQQAIDDGVEIFPFRLFDHHPSMESYLVTMCFKIRGVVDVELYKRALESLFEDKNWRKYGGRIRRNREVNHFFSGIRGEPLMLLAFPLGKAGVSCSLVIYRLQTSFSVHNKFLQWTTLQSRLSTQCYRFYLLDKLH
jgi:hypothetical protein